MRFGICLSLWTKQEWEDVAPSAPSKPAVVRDMNPNVSPENIERFKKACADAGLNPVQVAENAGVSLTDLHELDMPKLRASFTDLKEFSGGPKTVAEAVATVVELFNGEETESSVQRHPAGKGKPQIKEPGAPASPKQLGMIRALAKGKELNNDEMLVVIGAYVGRDITKLDDLSKGDASTVIDSFNKS
jgi:hypothetical protein